MLYNCWTVDCPHCGTMIFLDVIGPSGLYTFPVTPKCGSFIAVCPAPDCRKEHSYSNDDLKVRELLSPPLGTHHRAFVDALLKDDLPPS
jgi:hypothetical protein